MTIDVTELTYLVNEILEDADTIEKVIIIENSLHKHIGNLCDKAKEEIELNK